MDDIRDCDHSLEVIKDRHGCLPQLLGDLAEFRRVNNWVLALAQKTEGEVADVSFASRKRSQGRVGNENSQNGHLAHLSVRPLDKMIDGLSKGNKVFAVAYRTVVDACGYQHLTVTLIKRDRLITRGASVRVFYATQAFYPVCFTAHWPGHNFIEVLPKGRERPQYLGCLLVQHSVNLAFKLGIGPCRCQLPR